VSPTAAAAAPGTTTASGSPTIAASEHAAFLLISTSAGYLAHPSLRRNKARFEASIVKGLSMLSSHGHGGYALPEYTYSCCHLSAANSLTVKKRSAIFAGENSVPSLITPSIVTTAA